MEAGDGLLSQEVSLQVPSTLTGLTTVFGMGTGVAPSRWSPAMAEVTNGTTWVVVVRAWILRGEIKLHGQLVRLG